LFVAKVVSSAQRNGRSRTPRSPLQWRDPGIFSVVQVSRFNPGVRAPRDEEMASLFACASFRRFRSDASSRVTTVFFGVVIWAACLTRSRWLACEIPLRSPLDVRPPAPALVCVLEEPFPGTYRRLTFHVAHPAPSNRLHTSDRKLSRRETC